MKSIAAQLHSPQSQPPGMLEQLRADTSRAVLAARKATRNAREELEKPRPVEDLLPAISKEAAGEIRFYKRIPPVDVMLSGDALVVNEAYINAKVKQTKEDGLQPIVRQPQQAQKQESIGDASALAPSSGCETCKARQYQDGSNDSGVSFQAAAGMSASLSGVRVASHEGEHVSRESADAQREGETITDKHVTMQMRFCPDCGRMYAAGGKTTIQKISRNESEGAIAVQSAAGAMAVGEQVDAYI